MHYCTTRRHGSCTEVWDMLDNTDLRSAASSRKRKQSLNSSKRIETIYTKVSGFAGRLDTWQYSVTSRFQAAHTVKDVRGTCYLIAPASMRCVGLFPQRLSTSVSVVRYLSTLQMLWVILWQLWSRSSGVKKGNEAVPSRANGISVTLHMGYSRRSCGDKTNNVSSWGIRFCWVG